jgi:hypothetical protein
VRTDFKSSTALSVAAGESTAAQDLHWLEKNVPCQAACPAGTDIPSRAIYYGCLRGLPDQLGMSFPRAGGVPHREVYCRHGWEAWRGGGDRSSKRSAAILFPRPVVLNLIPQRKAGCGGRRRRGGTHRRA